MCTKFGFSPWRRIRPLCHRVLAVWCSIPTEHINTLRSRNAKGLVLKTGGSLFTVRPWRVKIRCMEDQPIVVLMPWQAMCSERYSNTPPHYLGRPRRRDFHHSVIFHPEDYRIRFPHHKNRISVTTRIKPASAY